MRRALETTLAVLDCLQEITATDGENIRNYVHPQVFVTSCLTEMWSASCDTGTVTNYEELLLLLPSSSCQHWHWCKKPHQQNEHHAPPANGPFLDEDIWPITSAEDEARLLGRIRSVLRLLRQCRERRVMVVGHGGFFRRLLNKKMRNADILFHKLVAKMYPPILGVPPSKTKEELAPDSANKSASVLYQPPHLEILHVFVDSTNISLGAQKLFGVAGGLLGSNRNMLVNVHNLAEVVASGRTISEKWVVGSACRQTTQDMRKGGMKAEWEQEGYHIGNWSMKGNRQITQPLCVRL